MSIYGFARKNFKISENLDDRRAGIMQCWTTAVFAIALMALSGCASVESKLPSEATDGAGANRVLVTLSELRVRDVPDWKSNEIYVQSTVYDGRKTDWSGESKDDSRVTDETADPIEGSGGPGQRKIFYNVFKRIGEKSSGQVEKSSGEGKKNSGQVKKYGQLSLSGDGIVLYPAEVPNGILSVHVNIIEQDMKEGKKRQSAQVLENLGKTVGNLKNLSIVEPLLSAILRSIGNDDILFSHTHSGFDYNGYGTENGYSEFRICNDKVYAILTVNATGTKTANATGAKNGPKDAIGACAANGWSN